MSEDNNGVSHPYCLLAYRWIAAWVHLVYFLSDKSEALQEYHEFFSKAYTPSRIETDLVECIRHFFHYFVSLENIGFITKGSYETLTPYYGSTLPLASLVHGMSDRDKDIFRTFTMDVYMSVADASVVDEAGIVPTPEEEYWFSNLSK
jgi:hypothetical protein